ncbi:MAG: hypothetical protein JGK26_04005 [Microcoleus sp. PH2017_27_LUM_O_A]|uniref:hypothetical protein n=1 Tax=Microcoleus sp. PH2017_27_LUM_O_A TaxID=2798837 RepID=UPI001D298B34|nr:hypothetical protein [Microcoleus sp. PH2017_27_LUM_O_A]MCC3458854.1 hypothetical protein [Microcoleus sp. PH2017_11_PCY_U_A]MCC3528289.1 hypothetical protein [Microcoleus sp. PH2017_21_RUC_O_A]MCC3558294.1 hypothetical protein [Microcoleus sp. PH2017_27_LUM_O_A]
MGDRTPGKISFGPIDFGGELFCAIDLEGDRTFRHIFDRAIELLYTGLYGRSMRRAIEPSHFCVTSFRGFRHAAL